MAGSRIVAEAARRGHSVSGFSRSERTGSERTGSERTHEQAPDGVSFFTADAGDRAAMSRIAAQHDVIVLATRPVPGTEDEVSSPVTTVLDAALEYGRRVIVIGGAGPLTSPDADHLVVDDPHFVPPQWRTIAQASVDQLHVCLNHPAEWAYLSPAALFGPGERTGHYRRGTHRLLVDADGRSHISAEDLAIAALDEIEQPAPEVRHFTVAY